MLDLSDKNAKAAILNLYKELKENLFNEKGRYESDMSSNK